jgi:predicted enzyme related to lactoylglutathione lyase
VTTGPGLDDAPLMFVFLDVPSLPRQRRLLEDVLQLRLIEDQFHPPHEHHGLAKYDAGGTILAINLFAERKFSGRGSDAVTLVCRTTSDELPQRLSDHGRVDGRSFTDTGGHHYLFRDAAPDDPELVTDIVEMQLNVTDLAVSVPFYRDVLGLRMVDASPDGCCFRTGSLDLVLRHRPATPGAEQPRYSALLMVFYTADVVSAARRLTEGGLVFRTRPGFSDIGGTARFSDPSGHVFCLYQPSPESLTWGSAGKVLDLMTGGRTAGRRHALGGHPC